MRPPETETPEFYIEIFLEPGEFFWADEETRIKTILGSCVAICMWHPQKKIGGMSHSLLSEGKHKGVDLDARYVFDAVQMFEQAVDRAGTFRSDYVVKLFGGSTTMEKQPLMRERYISGTSTGQTNAQFARRLLLNRGFRIESEHTGDVGYRNLIFDMWSGNAWLRHIKPESEKGKT